jgi:dipeptidyl aminopeptidase/acylaminoacyl peptidase
MRTILIGILLGAANQVVWGQQPVLRGEALYRRLLDFPSLVKGGVIRPVWMADSTTFWYPDSGPDRTVVYRVDPRLNSKEPLFDLGRTRAAIATALGHEPPYSGLPFSTFTMSGGERAVRFTLEGRDWSMDRATYAVTPIAPPTPADRDRQTARLVRRGYPTTGPDLYELRSPDGRWFATELEENLWLRSTQDGRLEQLTRDGAKDFGWNLTGAKWSPDGLRIAALKVDQREMSLLPLVHWLKPIEEVEWWRYSKVGGAFARSEVHVVDGLGRRAVPVSLESGDSYLELVGWRPDGSELILMRGTRDLKRLEVIAADPATGKARVVLTETQATFIKGIAVNPGWRQLITLLDDGKRFLWISERDGWDHLYLYDLEGRLIRRLTSGAWPVLSVVAVDTKNGFVYFNAHAESRVYDTHLYRVGLDGQGMKRLTEGTGTHAVSLSPSKEFFVDVHSNVDRPPSTELRRADGTLLQVLARANVDSLRGMGWRHPEEFVAKAADGATDLHGVLYRPADFDPTKRYPVIEVIYGGPQRVHVGRAFTSTAGGGLALAQLGFITYVVDGRGTAERGKVFQDVAYRNFGRHEIPDHVAVLKQLGAARPYMDLGRVGITGGSWGGYMTIRALLLAPETYHVGVAGAPVGDLYDHMAAAIEPYMGLVETNREGYDYASSLRLADRLKGRLLIMHGTSDVNATFSAAMKLVDAFTRAGKEYDLKVFLELNHSITGVAEYWQEATRQYFVRHLRPESAP